MKEKAGSNMVNNYDEISNNLKKENDEEYTDDIIFQAPFSINDDEEFIKEEIVEENTFDDDNFYGELDQLDYFIVPHSQQSQRKLYDSNGYVYSPVNESTELEESQWQCLEKNNGFECNGSVQIISDGKLDVILNHNHPSNDNQPFATLNDDMLGAATCSKYSVKCESDSSMYNASLDEQSSSRRSSNDFEGFSPQKQLVPNVLDYFSEARQLDTNEKHIYNLNGDRELENGVVDRKYKRRKSAQERSRESSPNVSETSQESPSVLFKVVKSLGGNLVLYDSLGFSYNADEVRGTTRVWICQADCDVRVIQEESEFLLDASHSHEPKRSTLQKISKMKFVNSPKEVSPPTKRPSRNSSRNTISAKKPKTFHAKKSSNAASALNEKRKKPFKREIKCKLTPTTEQKETDVKGPTYIEVKPQLQTKRSYSLNRDVLPGKTIVPLIRQATSSEPGVYREEDFQAYRELVRLAVSNSKQTTEERKYLIVENGNVRGGPKLYDSAGYGYDIRGHCSASHPDKIIWSCDERHKAFTCGAKINQRSFTMTPRVDHRHPPDIEKFFKALLRNEANEMVKDPSSLKRSGLSVIESIVGSYNLELPFEINMGNLGRSLNMKRKVFAIKNDLSYTRYTLNKHKIPKSFLLQKISTLGEYKFHIALGTEYQLAYLAAASEWYIDEVDFELAPFTNLLSIHIFIHKKEEPIQIPVFYAIMSDRLELDYSRVFQSITSALPEPPKVSTIVIDFNMPLRKSISKIFRLADIKCCDLHWSEAIASRLDEMSLQEVKDKPEIMNYVYQLPLLNLIPRQDFETALSKIEAVIPDESVQDLICYIRETFGQRSLWNPSFWSYFKMPVQVNYHDQWRQNIFKSGEDLKKTDIYSFIRSLHEISLVIEDDLRLMSRKKIKNYYIKRPNSLPGKIYLAWKEYCRGNKDCHILLKNLASFIRMF